MTTSETTIRTAEQRAASSRRLGRLSLIPTAAAAVAGWSASFIGLHGFAVKQMSGFTVDTAWLVPGAFDLSAFGSTVLVYRASINGRSGFRSRVMMYLFTALSAWINWIHQGNDAARFVACVLPVAAVIVFDGLAAEYRADWEADHGKKAFRMRFGLLLLRRMVDKEGTRAAFREQITAIPVSALVGLGADLSIAATAAAIPEQQPAGELEQPAPELELPPADDPSDVDVLQRAEPPAWSSMTTPEAVERADAILAGPQRGHDELAGVLRKLGIETTGNYVRTARRRARKRSESATESELEQHDAEVIPFQREAHSA